MKRWDEQIIEHLDAILEIADYWRNPFVNDAGGSTLCNDMYVIAKTLKQQMKHNHIHLLTEV